MYAIVDIETTGGHATANGITEIAIVLHNGHVSEGRFHTLVNPKLPIPRHITALTGISNAMVEDAPVFESIADKVFNLLQGRIFVAHNVNFDYSFLHQQLGEAGYTLNTRKLCTVRLARKIIPGLQSYSLGRLCHELGIQINGRHRALGDTMATVELFERLLRHDTNGVITGMLRGRNKEQYLPPHLPSLHIEQLPDLPGVYYFYNEKNKIVYVGKAANIRKRVKSHFSNNDGGKRKQELLRSIYGVSFRVCSSELAALVLESTEIRRLWPQFNRSQKKYHHAYGLYSYEDRNGYLRLFIEKKKQHLSPVYTFNLLHEGQVLLRKMISEFGLHESLCFMQRGTGAIVEDPAEAYNLRVRTAIASLEAQLPTFAVTDRDDEEASYFLMEKGRFAGMGNWKGMLADGKLELLKEGITAYPDNDYVRGLIYQFAEKYPGRKIQILS